MQTRQHLLSALATSAFAMLSIGTATAQAPQQASTPAPRAEWVTLGTSGGPSVQAERSQIANALVVGDAVYLFDVGNGVQRQMAKAHIPERNVAAVFITHHHLDHNASLGPIIMTHWSFKSGKLPIYGPAGTVHLASGLAAANTPTELAGFPTAGPAKPPATAEIEPHDLPDDIQQPTLVFQDSRVRVWAIGVDHYQVKPSIPLAKMPQAVAYRVEAGGRVFVFTGDSGPSARLIKLASGADVLISEIVEPEAVANQLMKNAMGAAPRVRDAVINGMSHNHLTSAEVGKLASTAQVKRVVLTHFVPSPEVVSDRSGFTDGIFPRRWLVGQSTISATRRCISAAVRTPDDNGTATEGRIEEDFKEKAIYFKIACI
ncbi:MBL fold metallo-hydrolase [Novosphingobium humi]|uniref:MBL fold metallo-hydrolase n=1 Tax=Novosphingobium humi TaxID=2282397 RepID=UPI0025B23ACC|nr:MBL fold metallo-hydrolase [Novosphingobium humi]WJT00771.1 MBL fold metallo-hydrolase [Novosphingobium humi]